MNCWTVSVLNMYSCTAICYECLFKNYEILLTVRWLNVISGVQWKRTAGEKLDETLITKHILCIIEFHRGREYELISAPNWSLVGHNVIVVSAFFDTSLDRGVVINKIVKLGLYYAFHGCGRLAAKINW